MAKRRVVERTVTLTSPYGSKVTVSAASQGTYIAAGYKQIVRRSPVKQPAAKK